MRARTNFVGVCKTTGEFSMSNRSIKDANRRREINAYKKEKEALKAKELQKDIISVYMFGNIKEITKLEWENMYKPMGFKRVED